MDRKTLYIILGAIAVLAGLDFVSTMQKNRLSEASQAYYAAEIKAFEQEAEIVHKRADEITPSISGNLASVAKDRGWVEKLSKAEETISRDEKLLQNKVKPLLEEGKKTDEPALSGLVEQLKNDRKLAVEDTAVVSAEVEKFKQAQNDPDAIYKAGNDNYNRITGFYSADIENKVGQAKADWPQKQADLQSRLEPLLLAKLTNTENFARLAAAKESEDWAGLAAAALTLEEEWKKFEAGSNTLSALVSQLYYSKDKILEDMEEQDNKYYHQYKIITIDRNNTQTSDLITSEVDKNFYETHKNNLGMTLETKPKGFYDLEAQKTASPPGFSYVGNPNYGTWNRDSSGTSFWVFYGQYKFLESLFWGGYYQPVYYRDYSTFRDFSNRGKTFYGAGNTKTYGTDGQFTTKKYGGSKYMQKGSFASSKYTTGSSRSRSYSRGFTNMSGGSIYRGK